MVETILVAASESRSPAEALGRIVGALLIPGIGLLLLIMGLRQRGQSRRGAPPPLPPGYPPQPGGPWPYPAQYPAQPPGWPAAGQPYPQPYPPPGQPYPPPANPTRGTALIAVGSVVLALGVLGGVGAAAVNIGKSRGLSVGECISEASYASENLNSEAIDCSRDDAVYELASKGDGTAKCADGERDQSEAYALLVNDARTYCFAINAREGECYHLEAHKNVFAPVSCSSSEATVKVDRRIDGSTDTTKCAEGTKALAIPLPARLYCFAAPDV